MVYFGSKSSRVIREASDLTLAHFYWSPSSLDCALICTVDSFEVDPEIRTESEARILFLILELL